MKLSIGILAYNEETMIAATISSLLAQSVIADPSISTEIIVVTNGCSDKTAEVAADALSNIPLAALATSTVFEVDCAGKANAWNILVHEASAADTDYFILLDADIEFAATDAIERLVRHLEDNAEILIAPDQPVKKFAAGGGPLRPLIRALQKTGGDDDHALSGQLYAARASALRAVRMPLGLVVEDGFLRAMILTANFSGPETLSRIRRAPCVTHFYAPYESPGAIWRYERRQAAGTAINRFLYDEFRLWRSAGIDINTEIRRRNAADADWIEALIADRAGAGGAILVPKNYMLRRLRRRGPWSLKRMAKTPLIAASVLFDTIIALDASRELRRRGKDSQNAGGGHWDAIRSG